MRGRDLLRYKDTRIGRLVVRSLHKLPRLKVKNPKGGTHGMGVC